jgi:hypothetical protein
MILRNVGIYLKYNTAQQPSVDMRFGVCRKFPTFRAIALMMEAANTSETSVNFYQTTRRNNPDDSHHLSTTDSEISLSKPLWGGYSLLRLEIHSSP